MTVKTPPPPPLPDELDRLLRRLRLPYVRRAAPDKTATGSRKPPPARGSDHSPNTPDTSKSVGGEIRGHQRGETMATSGEIRGRQWGKPDGH